MRQRIFRRSIERLGPYPSLVVVGLPVACVELLKLAAVFVLGDGHWITGTVVMILAYALSLFLVERLFAIAKPKLLTLPWFAAIWKWFVALRGKTWRWIRTRWTFMSERLREAHSRRPQRAKLTPQAKVKRAR